MRSAWIILGLLTAPLRAADEGLPLTSPGGAPSRVDPAGRLVEDWGAIAVSLSGAGLGEPTAPTVTATRLDDVTPAATATWTHGPLRVTTTAFRAPAWPAGLDVLTVRVEETAGQPAQPTLLLDLPPGATLGPRTIRLGQRTVMLLPDRPLEPQEPGDWGHWDDAGDLPGWGKPSVPCDPAFRNIRANLTGGPLVYRFRCEAGAAARVALGLCESHWAEAGRRPLVARVEGAPTQEVDPVTRWGQHRPGALLCDARDANGDGWLEVIVTTPASAPDRNPILNGLWLFPAGAPVTAEDVITGRLAALATRAVDCGGPGDQGLFPTARPAWPLTLAAREAVELTFLVACPKATLPDPETIAWTPATLRAAARDVWRDWPAER